MGDERLRAAIRAVSAHRRLIVAALVALVVTAAVSMLRPAPVSGVPVWVAARDLPGGGALTATDLRVARYARTDLPHDAVLGSTRVIGSVLAAPVRAGEPLTDVRLLTPALTRAAAAAGDVATSVRVEDGDAAAALVRPGDRVDVLLRSSVVDTGAVTVSPSASVTATPQAGRATSPPALALGDTAPAGLASVVVTDATVLAMPGPAADGLGGDDPSAGVVVIAVTTQQAAALAGAVTTGTFSLVVTAAGADP